jgi:hypothetical protein
MESTLNRLNCGEVPITLTHHNGTGNGKRDGGTDL